MRLVVSRASTFLQYQLNSYEECTLETVEYTVGDKRLLKKAYVLQFNSIEELIRFVQKYDARIAIEFDSALKLPTIEIYDDYGY